MREAAEKTLHFGLFVGNAELFWEDSGVIWWWVVVPLWGWAEVMGSGEVGEQWRLVFAYGSKMLQYLSLFVLHFFKTAQNQLVQWVTMWYTQVWLLRKRQKGQRGAIWQTLAVYIGCVDDLPGWCFVALGG